MIVADDARDRLGDLADRRVRGGELGMRSAASRPGCSRARAAGRRRSAIAWPTSSWSSRATRRRSASSVCSRRRVKPCSAASASLRSRDVADHREEVALALRRRSAWRSPRRGSRCRRGGDCCVAKGGTGPAPAPPTRPTSRCGKSGLRSETVIVEQLVAAVAGERAGPIVHVDEAAVAIDELEGLARHVRHLPEHLEVERRRERRGGRRIAVRRAGRTGVAAVAPGRVGSAGGSAASGTASSHRRAAAAARSRS